VHTNTQSTVHCQTIGLLQHSCLIVAQPYPVVQEVEADDMIMERLAFGMPPRCGKALREHLLHELQMWLLVKGCVKAQHRPGSL